MTDPALGTASFRPENGLGQRRPGTRRSVMPAPQWAKWGAHGGGMSARLSSMSGRNLLTVHRPDTRKKERARQPAHRCARRSCALVSHRPGEGGERRRGNKKGTNSSPPDRTRRTRRTTIVLKTPPHVLNDTAVHCDPPFGTKRPQVQILSPRPGIPAGQRPAPEMVRASLAARRPQKER